MCYIQNKAAENKLIKIKQSNQHFMFKNKQLIFSNTFIILIIPTHFTLALSIAYYNINYYL